MGQFCKGACGGWALSGIRHRAADDREVALGSVCIHLCCVYRDCREYSPWYPWGSAALAPPRPFLLSQSWGAASPSSVLIGYFLCYLLPSLTDTFWSQLRGKCWNRPPALLWQALPSGASRVFYFGCLLHLCGIFLNRNLFLKMKVIYKMIPYYTPATQPLFYCIVPVFYVIKVTGWLL